MWLDVPSSTVPTARKACCQKAKKVFIASSRGGQYTGDSPAAFLEHQESYLKAVLGFIGLTDVTIIRAENLSRGDEAKSAALADAKNQIASLA